MKTTAAVIFAFLIFIQSAAGGDDDYVFSQLKLEDGLSQSTIYSILQDHRGYMWFATGNALNKYDGYTFTVITSNPFDSTSLSDNGVISLFEDREGFIWVGTSDGGLNKYNRFSGTFSRYYIEDYFEISAPQSSEYYEYPLSFSRFHNYSITSIAEDDKGNIWIGTWGNGLLRYNKQEDRFDHFYPNGRNGSLNSHRISSLKFDSDHILWIGTFGGGLNRMTESGGKISFAHYSQEKLSDSKIITLYEDIYKNLWIGTFHGGLNKLSGAEKLEEHDNADFINYTAGTDEFSLSDNTVMAVTGDIKGYLWIGTFGGGLCRFDYSTKKFKRFINDPFSSNSLADNDVLSIYEDRSGILWIGSHLGEGVSLLKRNKTKFGWIKPVSSQSSGLPDGVVWSIYEDMNKFLWFGTYRSGLVKYDRSANKFYSYVSNPGNTNSISDNHVRPIAEDKFGNLWIGTYSGGLNRFDQRSGKFYRYQHDPKDPQSIGANQILDILIDDDGTTFWIGTFGGGLNNFKFDPINPNKIIVKRFTHNPSDSNSISDNRIYSLYRDRKGVMWIGTYGGGLNRFDEAAGNFISYVHSVRDRESISDNRVISIYEDTRGNYWISTYGGGLNKFDPETGKFRRYTTEDGINATVVYAVIEDGKGDLWISSDNGIYKKSGSGSFTRYDVQDGIQSLEFNGGSYFKSGSGEIFFGGINGVNYFYPDSIITNDYIPSVVITQVKIFNRSVKGERKELELPHDQNFISFEFSSLDYTNPSGNQYAYMLEGLDKGWQHTGSKMRMANYTNLSPGKYVFRVRGTNNDRIWNNAGDSIAITILPPFWQTWWFILLSILFVAGLIYYLSTLRIRNLLAIEKLKTKLAADLHDNIGAGLTEISILSELAAKKENGHSGNGGSSQLQVISETARQLVDNMSDIVWIVNPKRDSLRDLMTRIKDFYSDFLASIGVKFKTNNLEKLDDVKLPMDYRQNLYLIIKEGINNSVKHSKCSTIFLEANVRKDIIEIILKDNGIGMDPSSANGNGINNIERRAREIGGKVKWHSSPSEGTTMIFLGRVSRINKMKYFFNK